MYQLTPHGVILRLTDGASIPPDERNNDYRAYLEWCNDGHTPAPADPVPVPPEPLDVGAEAADTTDRTALQAAIGNLRQYVNASSPTGAQTVAALKLTIRLVLALARRAGV